MRISESDVFLHPGLRIGSFLTAHEVYFDAFIDNDMVHGFRV
jgi:hypothetical protein